MELGFSGIPPLAVLLNQADLPAVSLAQDCGELRGVLGRNLVEDIGNVFECSHVVILRAVRSTGRYEVDQPTKRLGEDRCHRAVVMCCHETMMHHLEDHDLLGRARRMRGPYGDSGRNVLLRHQPGVR